MCYYTLLVPLLSCVALSANYAVECCETGRLFFGSVGERYSDIVPVNGVYLLEGTDDEGFPVFKHQDAGFYLYHIRGNLLGTARPSEYWAVGPSLGSAEAYVSAQSAERHPARVLHRWRVWKQRSHNWKPEKRLGAKCVSQDFGLCESGLLRLHGLGAQQAVQEARLGMYRLTGRTHELRPVYAHTGGQEFLFFHGGLWLIGPVVGKVAGGLFVPDNAWRPELIIQKWVVFNGYQLVEDPVRISCEVPADDELMLTTAGDGLIPEDDVASGEPHSHYTHITQTGSAGCLEGSCTNGGVCGVLEDEPRECFCPLGYFGHRCENVVGCDAISSTRTTDVVRLSGTSFLDLAFLSCQRGKHGRALLTAVVCQADGTWSAYHHHCQPDIAEAPEVADGDNSEAVGAPEVVEEDSSEEVEDALTFELEGGRRRFRVRVDAVKAQLDRDDI